MYDHSIAIFTNESGKMMNRYVISAVCTVLFLAHPSAAQQSVFAVNEGVTYRNSNGSTAQAYKAIADDLAKILHHKVRVDVVGEYERLEKDLKLKTYDVALIHPTHIALVPVKAGTYSLIATSKAHLNYRANFLSKRWGPTGSIAEMGLYLGATGGKPVGSPDRNSITAWLVRATLRDAAAASNTKAPELQFTRYQDSIPHLVEYGFVDVAATGSPAITKEWIASGGQVMGSSRPVPIKNVIISNSLSETSIEAVRNYFLELGNTPSGQAKLDRIGLSQGFSGYDNATYLAIATWLGL
jgi:phosphonate transport system substrate-binding protein